MERDKGEALPLPELPRQTDAQRHALPQDRREKLFFRHHHAGRISGAADFQNECLLPQRRERSDRRVRSGEILVGREWENRFDSLATDNGVLFGQLSCTGRIGTAERTITCTNACDCYVCPGYTVIPKLRRNGLKGSFADIAPQKLMKALLSDSRVETILKSGRKRDLKRFIDHPQDLDFCWPSYKNRVTPEVSDNGHGNMGGLSSYARQMRQGLAQRPLCLPRRFENRA